MRIMYEIVYWWFLSVSNEFRMNEAFRLLYFDKITALLNNL